MTVNNGLALFGFMVLLAAVPGVSVLTVVTRSISCGFMHGAITTLGIVTGDVIFILVAIFGLSLLSESLGDLFIVVKYLGGIYLVYLGIMLWRRPVKPVQTGKFRESSCFSSYLTGLLITLGDQKAIFFYLGFFPAFLDLTTLTQTDAVIVVVIAALAITVTKLGYAYMAGRTGTRTGSKAHKRLNLLSGGAMVAIGGFLLTMA